MGVAKALDNNRYFIPELILELLAMYKL